MTIDRWILTAVWVLCIPAMMLIIPRKRWREAALLFVFNQSITWMLSLIQVEAGFAVNPVREFPRAVASNFTFNFILYPTVAVFFAFYYPKSGWLRKFLYVAAFVGSLWLFVWLVVHYTQLVRLTRFPWWAVILVFTAGFYATRKYYEWYFRLQPEKRGDSA